MNPRFSKGEFRKVVFNLRVSARATAFLRDGEMRGLYTCSENLLHYSENYPYIGIAGLNAGFDCSGRGSHYSYYSVTASEDRAGSLHPLNPPSFAETDWSTAISFDFANRL